MAKQVKKTEVGTTTAKADKPFMAGFSIRWYAIIVFAFSFLIYFNSAFNDYNLDDELVTRNHRLTSRGISAIPDIFTEPYYKDLAGYEYEYRPMVFVTFAIEHSFFGESPFVSHIINVLLYAGMCAFLFYVLLSIFEGYSVLFPFIVSMLFAAHPIHTEVVASIKNRDEILALLFGLAAVWYAVKYTAQGKWWQLALVPAMFVLGMLSKTPTIIFAILVPLTLILFTQVSFVRLMAVTTLLTIPAVLLSRLPILLYFILLALAVYVAVITLYVIKNREKVLVTLRGIVKSFSERRVDEEVAETSSNEAKAWLVLQGKPYLMIPFIVGVVLLVVFTAWGVWLADPWAIGVPMLAMVALYAIGDSKARLILGLPIGLLTTYMLMRLNGYPVLEGLLIGFIALQILDPDKKIKASGWITYIVYAVATIAIKHLTIFLALFFFAGFYHRMLMIPALIMLVVWLGAAIAREMGQNSGVELKYISFVVLYPLMYFIWRKRTKYLKQVVVVLIPIVAVAYFTLTVVNNARPLASVVNSTYTNINNIETPNVTPVESVRPLKYLEYPFDGTEAFSIKFGTSMVVLGKYMKLVAVPYPMSFYYGFAYIDQTDFYTAVPIIVFIIHIALFVAGLWFMRSRPVLSFGLLFYLVAIAPYTGLVTPVPGMVGDRFLLVPSLGFIVLLVYGLALLLKQPLGKEVSDVNTVVKPVKISLIVLLLAYSGVTIARNQDWQNHVQLFSKDVKVVENSVQANNLLGVHLLIASGNEKDLNVQESMRLQAIQHLKRSLELYPPYLNTSYDIGRTYGIMAEQYKALGNTAKAKMAYDSAALYFLRTTQIDTGFVTPYYSMGIIAQAKGDYPTAISYFEKYVKKYPDHQDASTQLSYTYFLSKQYEKAIDVSKEFLKKNPGKYEPMVNIAKTYLELNNLDSAVVYFEKAYDLNRGNANMVKMLYDVSTRMGDEKRKQFYGMELNRVATRR